MLALLVVVVLWVVVSAIHTHTIRRLIKLFIRSITHQVQMTKERQSNSRVQLSAVETER